ncbi:uncharacterized protein LOC124177790 [Neodiprion fabricii]|uniref:uncharacterized protein LOC124177790 n=1 Tax=Neodiprion fabricii TaxID=2872261 RepID=UPI001ED8C1C6|nr:uncharacterized protein LOC124177790 [Neodiprion fabricii]XP_046416555.1 uncharacterized protein LOC124177790 [Neodiprion fabricii]
MIQTEQDEAFYEEVLKNYFRDPTTKVRSVKQERATAKGENFLSDMLRIGVELTRNSSTQDDAGCRICERRSFISKHEPVGDSRLVKMVQEQQLFTVELSILKNVLPRIETALGIRLGPKLVYGRDEPPRVIIMEDLTPEGFHVKDRQEGLSMAHATMAIKNLARFHAGSVALAEENPAAIRRFRQGIFDSTTHPNFYTLAINSLIRLRENAQTWLDEDCILAAKKLKNVIGSLKQRIQDVYKYDPEEFCVLNHGDAWVNNMLFVEDRSGKPIEQVFVDYQMVGYSSPAIDLLYFLGINPALKIRGPGETELLETYLETLTLNMKRLRCRTESPTMEQLKEAMYRRRVYAVVSGLFLLPRMMLDKAEIESMDQLLKHGTFRTNAYAKPNTIRMMKRILPLMNERGYLDA